MLDTRDFKKAGWKLSITINLCGCSCLGGIASLLAPLRTFHQAKVGAKRHAALAFVLVSEFVEWGIFCAAPLTASEKSFAARPSAALRKIIRLSGANKTMPP